MQAMLNKMQAATQEKLDRRERTLNLRERALDIREKSLEDRECKVEMREKALKRKEGEPVSPVRSRLPTTPTPARSTAGARPCPGSPTTHSPQSKAHGGNVSARKAPTGEPPMTPNRSKTNVHGDQGDGPSNATPKHLLTTPGSASKLRDMFEQKARQQASSCTPSGGTKTKHIRRQSAGPGDRAPADSHHRRASVVVPALPKEPKSLADLLKDDDDKRQHE